MPSLAFNPHSEQIRTASRRLLQAYSRTPGHQIPIVAPSVPHVEYSEAEKIDDLDKMLEASVSWANALAVIDNDWPPMINTYCGVVHVAEAFGCKIIRGDSLWTEPAVGDISEVWSLKPLPVEESPLIRRLFEWVDYAQRKAGTDVPIWTMDVQSPFSVAGQVVGGTELFTACITHPKEVHHLCRMITDFSIEMMRKHTERMENPGFPGRNFPSIPEDIGICLADDTPLVMLGPDMYGEFALPYNAEIAKAFGRVHIHSCGNYAHNLDNLLRIPGIRSIQAHAGPGEFPLPASAKEDHPFNRARKRVAYFIDANDVTLGDEYRNRPKDHYEEYVLPRLKAGGELKGLILQSCGVGQDLSTPSDAVRWTRHCVRV